MKLTPIIIQLLQKLTTLFFCLSANYAIAESIAFDNNELGNSLALVGATIVSPHLSQPLEGMTVLITNGKIHAVQKGSQSIPLHFKVVSLEGMWLSPGLVDAHVHYFQSGSAFTRPDIVNFSAIETYAEDQNWIAQNLQDTFIRYLAAGVTTTVDLGGPDNNFSVRQQALKTQYAPTVKTAGPLISPMPVEQLNHFSPVYAYVKNANHAKQEVLRQLALKPDLIKFVWINDAGHSNKQLFELLTPSIQLARQHNMPVAVHVETLQNAKMAIKAGATSLIHGVLSEEIDEPFIELMKQHQVIYSPTLVAYQNYAKFFKNQLTFTTYEKKLAHPDVLSSFEQVNNNLSKTDMNFKMFRKYAPMIDHSQTQLAELSDKERAIVAQLKAMFASTVSDIQKKNLKRLFDADVTLTLGTDAGNIGTLHGASLLAEMIAWQQAGISNRAIFKAATINGAKMSQFDHHIGSIEVGKQADLLVLEQNPVNNLVQFANIQLVIKKGNILPTSQLKQYLIQTGQKTVNFTN